MPLSSADIRRAFDALSAEFEAAGERAEIVVVGGAALVLLFEARDTTKDVDAFFLSPDSSRVRTALAQLLAMKLAAWRDAVDDARLLLSRMPGAAGEVWDLVKPLVPRIRSTKRGTRSRICGRPFMELRDLVRAILSGDLLAARQWVADARRARISWETVGQPTGLNDREMTVAAGLAEVLAERTGVAPPSWALSVGGQREPLFLDPGLQDMPRTLAHAMANGPEPLRRRNLFASPDFLDVR
jgi:Nucleotidyltransferase of unknown function (DUF6036)